MARASRRVLTVLFADLVGFTSMSERLDPEDVAAIQSAYFGKASAAISRHGGLVEKFIGDAVVGSFGVLRARDDDAEQAVRAGLDIVEAVAELGIALGLEPEMLRIRVGVNTGVALIASEDAGDDWRITGDVMNVAARLQTKAQPGAVLIGADTALAVEPTMDLEPAGSIAVRGKAQPVPCWHVVRAHASTPDRTVPLRTAVPILGRDRELQLLAGSWQQAAHTPVSWLVTAPPGVGKSRLAREFADRIEAAGGQAWTTTAYPGDSSGYRCVADLLRHSLGSAADPLQVTDAVLSRLGRVGASQARAEAGAAHVGALLSGEHLETDPADLYSSWVSVLDAHPAPVAPVWIIEDLHHAGPDLMEFVRAAATHLRGPGRLLVLTTRPTAAVDELRRFTELQQLHLAPLPDTATVRMIEQLVGPDTLPASVVLDVAAGSGGNPLFVEELLRSWTLAGALQPLADGGWKFVGSPSGDGLPTSVQSVYLGQLDGLSAAPRQVVHSGSIPGHTFPSTALPVLDVPAPGRALELLTDVGLLLGPHPHGVDPVSYTYRHGLLREVAYASLTRIDRARLHQRFARWLNDTAARDDLDEAIGEHLAAAHEHMPRLAAELEGGWTREALAQEAGDRLEVAAQRHLNSAPQRAVLLLQRALGLSSSPRTVTDLRRLLVLGDAQRRSGWLKAAMRTFVQAAEVARHHEHALGQVTAALGYEEALFASRLPRSRWGSDGVRLLNEALDSLDPTVEESRARLLAALGRAQIYADATDETGYANCAAAVRLATESGSNSALAYALLSARAGQSEPHQLSERLDGLQAAMAAARRASDPETELEAARLRFRDCLEAGDIDGASGAQQRAESLIAQLGRPLYLWYPSMWAAMRALLHGELDSADPLVQRFREEGERWHYQDALRVHTVQALELHTQQGTPEASLPLLQSLLPEDPDRWTPVLATALARAENYDEAQTLLDTQARERFQRIPKDLSRTYLLALLAECADAVGDRAAAAELERLLGPWETHSVVLGSGAVCLGAVAHYAGLAARTAGDIERAATLLEASVVMNEAMGAVPAAKRSRAEYRLTRERSPS